MAIRLIEKAREVIAKLLGKETLAEALGMEMAVSDEMRAAIEKWSKMYVNKPPWLSEEIQSLNLASSIASEIARLTTLELESSVTGSERAEYLEKQYQAVLRGIRPVTEYAAAKGGLIFKPYVSGGDILVDYAQADMFIPIAFDGNGRITGCAFLDYETTETGRYTRVETHKFLDPARDSGGGAISRYQITNKAYYTDRNITGKLGYVVPLTEVPRWADIVPESILHGLERPLFAYFRMPFANSIDPGSPLGVSIYARATDLIKEADKQYSRLLWEFESGQRALYVDVTAFRTDRTTKEQIIPFKRLMRVLSHGAVNTPFFEEWTPTLREENILRGLDSLLCRIEDACGVARGSFSQAPERMSSGARTATELKIMRQRTYATILDVQTALQDALEQLVWAMDQWATRGELAPEGEYEMLFEFDDSVVVNRQEEFMERIQLVTAGVMQPWELRAWYLGGDEATAKSAVGSRLMMFPDEGI